MELSFIISAIRRRLWLIILFTIIGAVVGTAVSRAQDTNEYEATAALLVLSRPLLRGLSRWMPLPLALALSVPLAAQLVCGPIVALFSDTQSVIGVVANLLAAPAAPIATVIGLLAFGRLAALLMCGVVMSAVVVTSMIMTSVIMAGVVMIVAVVVT